jgi:stage V sporulation protein AC
MQNETKTNIKEVLHESSPQKREAIYNEYVKENTPKKSWFFNLCKAFFVGGLICVIGQILTNCYIETGMDKDSASSYTTLSLIFLSILFTGFNLYQKLANFAGAGTLVPITGFANSVAAPAIEFKEEGQVFGIGCKIFTIAGPVILYGVFASWLAGIVYWIGNILQLNS